MLTDSRVVPLPISAICWPAGAASADHGVHVAAAAVAAAAKRNLRRLKGSMRIN